MNEAHDEIVSVASMLVSPIVDTKYAPLFVDFGEGGKVSEMTARTADALEQVASMSLALSNRLRSLSRSVPIG